MRPNRYIILLSILLGAFGTWFSADAVSQYLSATRSMAAVNVQYVEDSFVWLDPDFERARADFMIVNDSDNEITILHFSQQLYFDGTFAGARYEPWELVTVPAGESFLLEVPYLISISEIRPRGGEAELTVRGTIRIDFEGFERDMTLPTGSVVGHVPFEGNQ